MIQRDWTSEVEEAHQITKEMVQAQVTASMFRTQVLGGVNTSLNSLVRTLSQVYDVRDLKVQHDKSGKISLVYIVPGSREEYASVEVIDFLTRWYTHPTGYSTYETLNKNADEAVAWIENRIALLLKSPQMLAFLSVHPKVSK